MSKPLSTCFCLFAGRYMCSRSKQGCGDEGRHRVWGCDNEHQLGVRHFCSSHHCSSSSWCSEAAAEHKGEATAEACWLLGKQWQWQGSGGEGRAGATDGDWAGPAGGPHRQVAYQRRQPGLSAASLSALEFVWFPFCRSIFVGSLCLLLCCLKKLKTLGWSCSSGGLCLRSLWWPPHLWWRPRFYLNSFILNKSNKRVIMYIA